MNKSLSYLQVENAVIHSPALSGNEKLFYIILKSFRNRKTGRCFPSIRRIIERASISKKTAYKRRERLKDIGLISWTNESGRKHSCNYRFILEDREQTQMRRVLEILKKEKIEKNETSLNREKVDYLNSVKGNPKVGQNEATNKRNITKRRLTNKGSDSLPTSLFSKEGEIRPMPDWAKEKLNKIFKPDQLKVDKNKERKLKAELRRQAQLLKTHPELLAK